MPPKPLSPAAHLSAEARQRSRFDPKLVFRLCVILSLILIPFSIWHLLNQAWTMLTVTTVPIFIGLTIGIATRRLGYLPHWMLISTATLTSIMALLSGYAAGLNSYVWAYPAVLFNYFLLGTRAGTVINVVFVALAATNQGIWSEPSFTPRAVLSLLTVTLFAWVFSRRVSEQREELGRLASTDSLTGVGNRRAMDEALEFAQDLSNRYGNLGSLLILDLDHFKAINDKFGHRTGDRVLAQFGDLLLKHKRHTDLAFRFGGEEFIMVLPETGADAAAHVAEDIRQRVETETWNSVGRITVSIGVAEVIRHDSVDDWMKRGDFALYHAKSEGRNRVVVAD